MVVVFMVVVIFTIRDQIKHRQVMTSVNFWHIHAKVLIHAINQELSAGGSKKMYYPNTSLCQ